jgi:hypothetical protein
VESAGRSAARVSPVRHITLRADTIFGGGGSGRPACSPSHRASSYLPEDGAVITVAIGHLSVAGF